MTAYSSNMAHLSRQLEALDDRIRDCCRSIETASGDTKQQLGQWLWGATKHRGRLLDALDAQTRGEHRLIIHEADDLSIWALCSCGARLLGALNDDFTPTEFLLLPGHWDYGSNPMLTGDGAGGAQS